MDRASEGGRRQRTRAFGSLLLEHLHGIETGDPVAKHMLTQAADEGAVTGGWFNEGQAILTAHKLGDPIQA